MAPNAVIWAATTAARCACSVAPAIGDADREPIGEPSANLPLHRRADHAGLDGLARGLAAPAATGAPYAEAGAEAGADAARQPPGRRALATSGADERLVAAFGANVVAWLTQVKRSELARHDAADDKDAWQAREYFSRF